MAASVPPSFAVPHRRPLPPLPSRQEAGTYKRQRGHRPWQGKQDGQGMARGLAPRAPSSLYDILNVSPRATMKEIKTRYYQECLRRHPDSQRSSLSAGEHLTDGDGRHSGEGFIELAEAYKVLRNEATRREYDRTIGLGGAKEETTPAAALARASARQGGRRPPISRQRRGAGEGPSRHQLWMATFHLARDPLFAARTRQWDRLQEASSWRREAYNRAVRESLSDQRNGSQQSQLITLSAVLLSVFFAVAINVYR